MPKKYADKFGMNMVDAYLLLENYAEEKHIEQVLFFECPCCHKTHWVFKTVFDISDTIVCNQCKQEINSDTVMQSAVVVYRKQNRGSCYVNF